MEKFGLRYMTLVGCTITLFVLFVACGAQFYKVSVDNDLQEERINAAATNPDSPTYGLHAPNGWNKLPIHFRVGFKLDKEQHAGVTNAITTWETAVGKKLFVFDGVHADVDGDSFKDLYGSLDDLINGTYIDFNWTKTGKAEAVLATTIWENTSADAMTIATSDIHFNLQHYKIGDSYVLTAEGTREVVDMQSLSLHELGHLLGLAHMKPSIDNYSIMNPSLYIGEGMANRRLSEGDITRIQKIYGCKDPACDIAATLAKIESAAREPDSEKIAKSEVPIEAQTAH